jgi:hypothetical protein
VGADGARVGRNTAAADVDAAAIGCAGMGHQVWGARPPLEQQPVMMQHGPPWEPSSPAPQLLEHEYLPPPRPLQRRHLEQALPPPPPGLPQGLSCGSVPCARRRPCHPHHRHHTRRSFGQSHQGSRRTRSTRCNHRCRQQGSSNISRSSCALGGQRKRNGSRKHANSRPGRRHSPPTWTPGTSVHPDVAAHAAATGNDSSVRCSSAHRTRHGLRVRLSHPHRHPACT